MILRITNCEIHFKQPFTKYDYILVKLHAKTQRQFRSTMVGSLQQLRRIDRTTFNASLEETQAGPLIRDTGLVGCSSLLSALDGTQHCSFTLLSSQSQSIYDKLYEESEHYPRA